MSTWFANWFDSNYYHLLYQNRNDREAQFFMNNLIKYLKIRSKSKILDLACGKGRHSIYLANKGFEVFGVDLSKESNIYIKKANHLALLIKLPFNNYISTLKEKLGWSGNSKEI